MAVGIPRQENCRTTPLFVGLVWTSMLQNLPRLLSKCLCTPDYGATILLTCAHYQEILLQGQIYSSNLLKSGNKFEVRCVKGYPGPIRCVGEDFVFPIFLVVEVTSLFESFSIIIRMRFNAAPYIVTECLSLRLIDAGLGLEVGRKSALIIF
jgi:hypothetical protein